MAFGEHLRDWRRRRGMSQLRLALEADVSARHIAFLETGKANPTRGMVIRLSEALEVPRAERNVLLEAAGFAGVYALRTLAAEDMASIRAALEWTLQRHDPYPAIAFDRHWVLVSLNRAATGMLSAVGLAIGDSMLDALLDPSRLRSSIDNWPEVAAHMRARLRTESRHLGGDPVLDRAADLLMREVDPKHAMAGALPAVITTRYLAGGALLSFFSTIAQFGSAQDIALADLKIELLFPADEATRRTIAAGVE